MPGRIIRQTTADVRLSSRQAHKQVVNFSLRAIAHASNTFTFTPNKIQLSSGSHCVFFGNKQAVSTKQVSTKTTKRSPQLQELRYGSCKLAIKWVQGKKYPKINDVENGIGLQEAAGSTPDGGELNLNPSKVQSVALAQPCLSFVWTARNALVLWVSQDFWSVINKN